MAWLIYAALALTAFAVYSKSWNTKRRRLPPGPKGVPILGNINDFPPAGTPEYLHWLKHKDLYGGISSVTVMGMTLVLIHDKDMAHEMLDQMASKTSGRPSMVMANKLCGYESIVVCQGYNPTFRRYRKFLHQVLGTKASAAQFHDAHEAEVSRQLVRTLQSPDNLLEHYKTTAAATVLKMTYGYTIEPHKPDRLVQLIEKMGTEFSLAAMPMTWAVDIVPALQYLPENFPGASFKKTARRWRRSIQATAHVPYEFVRRQMASFPNRSSYVSRLIQELTEAGDGALSKEDEHSVIWTAASLYGAAADTTVITLTAFTLAMLKFPEVQRKAQEEIDRVIGTNRLPTIQDRDNLPYIDALVKEATRWWPIAPFGFPHTTTEEFEFQDYTIPQNAIIMPSVYWFLQDPNVYADPKTFDPSRFLPPRNEPDPVEAFGFGRRFCPGRFFADTSLYLNMVHTLAVFDLRKAVDVDGVEMEVVDVKPRPGVLTYPSEFKFRAMPRSEKHVELVRELGMEYPFEESDAMYLQNAVEFQG